MEGWGVDAMQTGVRRGIVRGHTVATSDISTDTLLPPGVRTMNDRLADR